MTLASLVFGVAALILAGGFIEDTIVETGESIIHSSSGHLQVARQGYWTYGVRSPEAYLIEDPEPLRQELARTPGVDDVLLRIGFSGLLGNGRTDWSVIAEGVEPTKETKLGHYITLVSGRQLKDDDPFGILIGQGVAKALKLQPGDPVTLLVSTAGGATNVLEFQVTGIFQTFSKDYDARAVRIPLATAQDLLATPGAHTAVVVLHETEDTGAAADALVGRLPGKDYEVKTWIDLNPFYTQTVELYQQQFGFLTVIILFMLLLSVSNTVNMSIFERAAEFGTMRAMGNRSAAVFRLIVLENLLLGIAGSAIGAGLGIALALAISAVGIPMPPPPNADMGYISRILVVPWVIALSFCIGIAAAVLASLPPARRVSRMDIVEGLRQAV
jgi:putative ABC transport system permease protein